MSTQDKPKKKKVKVTRNENGHPVEVEIEVDDVDGPSWGPRAGHTLVNHDVPRVDGPVKVSGRAPYPHDIRLPGMLHARVLCARIPAGSVKLDLESARKTPGVEVVLDLEVKEIRWLGQPVAAVAATTPEKAADGLRALAAQFEAAGFAVTPEQALAPNAPQVTRRGNKGKESENGDAEAVKAALAAAAGTARAEYSVPVQHHASLETHGVVVDYSGGDEARIYASTQSTFGISEDAAEPLGLKASQIETISEYMGGGFGAKFGLGIEGLIACRLAKLAKRPVHLLLTRKDEFLAAGNRSGSRVVMEGGIGADGKLTALRAEIERHGGIGGGSHARQPYVYSVEKVYTKSYPVHTNTDGSRAMRAPGHPQASFAIESLIDELCYAAKLDLLEVRKKNLANPTYARQLERVAREIGWYEHPHRTQPGRSDQRECIGIGFGVSTWGGGGGESCEVDVRIERDGSVTSSVGTQDLGTGTRTYVASIVAEEFGLGMDGVTARIGSSRLGNANASGGSTTVASLAPAVKNAAWKARMKFAEHLAPLIGTQKELLRFEKGELVDQQSGKRIPFAKACAMLPNEGLQARGTWVADLAGNGIQGAQAAKVRVDPLTGRVEVLKMVCVQNCGLPINRLTLRSQIFGGMVQALSYALLEERIMEPSLGLQINPNFEDYKLAGSLEIGEIVAIIDDEDTREQAIGVSEATIVPGHSAIANAVANACGARVRHLPLTPDKVLAALGKA
jgi:xanthine dehydrogenase YagR molybdenum-binding subunit